jgi:16S rRNA (guanine527-N7)-methyltransferase
MSAEFAVRLDAVLAELGLPAAGVAEARQLAEFAALLLRWNRRINLTAIRDEEGILRRHFAESIACARALPAEISTLLDFGSGAGFPGIPIAIFRPEITVTLAESQSKKAAFLREAIRVLGISAAVHGGRAEDLEASFDCVTLRAVDRMPEAVATAARLVKSWGWLAPMTTNAALNSLKDAAGADFLWEAELKLVGGAERILALGRRSIEQP